MNKPDPVLLLKELIRTKELEQQLEEKIVREQFHRTYESLKPLNLIRNAVHQVVSSPELKGDLGNAALGIISGFIAKKAISFGSSNPLVKLGATIVQMIVAGKVTQNADDIKAIAAIVLNKIMNHQRNPADEKTNE